MLYETATQLDVHALGGLGATPNDMPATANVIRRRGYRLGTVRGYSEARDPKPLDTKIESEAIGFESLSQQEFFINIM